MREFSPPAAPTVSVPVKLALIFGTSALAVVLQLLQSRILAVQFWHHLVYFVITLGFLGFAVSGTYLSVSRRISSISERAFLAVCLGGLALGIFVSRVVLAVLPNTHFGFLDLGSMLPLTLAYVALMIPYFFAGLLVGGALRREPRAGGALYFASLAGSAAGCLLFVALITPLGATMLLQALFLSAALLALLLWRLAPRLRTISLLGVAAGTAALAILPIEPDRGKQYWSFAGPTVEFSEWNPISRIDVLASLSPLTKYITIDGDAWAPMYMHPLPPLVTLDTPHRDSLYAVAEPGPGRVLVIGVGGGADVLTAKRHGARIVDAVEINPTTARLLTQEYGEFTGHLLSRDGVTLYNEDGRSFAARSPHRYDVIVLFAVDSLAASSTGAYVLMENYLYTLEAFRRYWQLLSDRGVLQISRWHHPNAPNETLRTFIQAYEAMAAEGIKDPGRHLAVIGDVGSEKAPFADVIISKQPLTQDRIDSLRRFAESKRFEVVYTHASLAAGGALQRPGPFQRFAEAHTAGRQQTFYREYPFNVAPVTDNDPFFFSYRRWTDVLPQRVTPSVEYYDNIVGTKPLVLLIVLVGMSVVIAAALVLWPLIRLRDRHPVTGSDSPVLLFFALIGVGFMFIEISLIQRFVLLLGHPTYSMSVSLPSILLGAALGSYLSGRGRFGAATRVGIAMGGIVLAIAALEGGHESLVARVLPWGLPSRLAVVAGITAIFGLFMGIPFPTAVAALARQPHLISLGWTINGGTTVVASVLAIPVAMAWGFSAVLVTAAACYVSAWCLLLVWRSTRRTREPVDVREPGETARV